MSAEENAGVERERQEPKSSSQRYIFAIVGLLIPVAWAALATMYRPHGTLNGDLISSILLGTTVSVFAMKPIRRRYIPVFFVGALLLFALGVSFGSTVRLVVAAMAGQVH